MARDSENAANATEATAKAVERVPGEAEKAGDRVAAATVERIGTPSGASGGAEAAFKAVRAYNTKLVQVFQTNAEANLRLGQTLMQVRTPSDFLAAMSQSMRERTDLIAGQTKELAALRHEATRRVFQAIAPGR